MTTKTFTPDDLRQFTGTQTYYRHWLKFMYTDGVKHFADQAGAYWFLDIVGTEIFQLREKEDFIVISMKVKEGQAVITADDGNNRVLWDRDIEYTDCPEGLWRFYLVNEVMMVPFEY